VMEEATPDQRRETFTVRDISKRVIHSLSILNGDCQRWWQGRGSQIEMRKGIKHGKKKLRKSKRERGNCQ